MRYVTDLKVPLRTELDVEWDELGRTLSLRSSQPGVLINTLRELQAGCEEEIEQLQSALAGRGWVAADG